MPYLLMMPGMDGTGTLFQPLLNALTSLDDTINCHVLSYPFEPLLNYQQLTQLVIDQLPENEPFYLLAESFSGPIAYQVAQQLAQKNPKNLQGVVFVATFLTPPRTFLTSLAAKLPWQILKRFEAPDWFTRRYLLGKSATPEIIEQFWQVVAQLPPKLIAFRIKQMSQLSLPDTKLTTPALYIAGRQDQLVPNSHIGAFEKSCENLDVSVIDGPHFLLQSEPNRCAQLIKGFIADNQTVQ